MTIFNNIDLPTDQINKLRKLIGINLTVAMRLFAERGGIKAQKRGYNKEVGGFPEELVALLLDEKRPTSSKGADFENFELKSIKANFTKKGDIRTGGDTPISNWDDKDIDFATSNIYNKLRKVVYVFHFNNIIVDIRFFDGEKMFSVLKNDYELIASGKNTETTILTRKSTGSVQIKKGGAIRLSTSIINGVDNEILSQEGYITNLFGDKLDTYKKEMAIKSQSNLALIMRFLNNTHTSISELKQVRNLITEKIDNAVGFNDIPDELEF